MAFSFHDPGHLALRRGVRAAIALPLTMAITLYEIDDAAGVLFAVFGTIGLLVNADFAGTALQRTSSYLLTGVAGAIALTIGWAASFSTPVAAIVTFIVAFALSFVNLVRGAVAVGTAAVLLVFVVAVSIESTVSSLPAYLLAWTIAVVVSTLTALVILPHDQRLDQRSSLADVFDAAAHGVETSWLGDGSGDPFADVDAAIAQLNAKYGGQPFRTSGLTTRDQALTLLVDHANSAGLLLGGTRADPAHNERLPLPERNALAEAVAAGLRDVARAMRDRTFIPSGAQIDDARVRLVDGMERWVVAAAQAGTAPQAISERVSGDHLLRMYALIVEQTVELARVVNGAPVESLERQPPVPVRRRSRLLRAQIDWHSSWLRNSLRSALGLTIAVLVINITGVQHGFWVLLGVISILRYDVVGTRKFAVQAVIGTVVGAALASALLVTVPSATTLWILLPIFVFLAAWSAVAISYPVGQAAFSALILVALGIIVWPPQLDTAITRVEDIALGAAVALVVGVLMWPRGAVGQLRAQLSVSLRSASTYMSMAIASFLDGISDAELSRQRSVAVGDVERASETYDLALMQRGPAEDMHPWTRATTAAYLLISAGRVIAHFARTTPRLEHHAWLQSAIQQARAASDAHWRAVADEVAGTAPVMPDTPASLPLPVAEAITTTEDAHALITAVWVVDWVQHLDRLSPARTAQSAQLA